MSESEKQGFEACWAEIGAPHGDLWLGLAGTVQAVARDAYMAGRRDAIADESSESRATASQPNSDSVAEGAAFGTHSILGEWTL